MWVEGDEAPETFDYLFIFICSPDKLYWQFYTSISRYEEWYIM
jgi:hypothetical protein